MMNIWHVIWIVPLSASIGLLCGCMLCAAAREDERRGRQGRTAEKEEKHDTRNDTNA